MCVGRFMVLHVREITTKAGNPFTVHDYLREATPEDFATFGLEVPTAA